MTRRIMGLDLNGWHDFAAREANDEADEAAGEDEASSCICIDGGVASVVVSLNGQQSERPVSGKMSFVGGPQAIHSPIGLGGGWGTVGSPELRTSVLMLLRQCLAGKSGSELEGQLRAAVDALTLQADEVLLTVPDLPNFDDGRQDFLLNAIRRRGRTARLLWRSVAATLQALETGTLPALHDGMRVTFLEHTATGFDVQTLSLRHLEEHAGIFAPERKEVGFAMRSNSGLDNLLDQARQLLAAANPNIEERQRAQSRLPVRLLLEDGISETDEILRNENGTWYRIVAPGGCGDSVTIGDVPVPSLDGVGAVLLATPLCEPLARHLAKMIGAKAPCPVVLLDKTAIATGALVAGRRIDRGIPHYLDHLEQMSLVVLRGGTVVLEDLVSGQAVVPANREYKPNPVTGYAWPSGVKSVTFYLRKAGEFRKWRTDEIEAPVTTVPVAARRLET